MLAMSHPDPYVSDRRAKCLAGRHVAALRSIRTDPSGLERSKCRYCRCELARLPTIGRWFASGLMGEPPT